MQAGKLRHEEAIGLFRCLRDTATLGDWQKHHERILQTEGFISAALEAVNADPTARPAIAFRAMLNESPMLELHFSAVSRGLQLLQQQGQDSSRQKLLPGSAVQSVAICCSSLCDCLFLIYLTTPPGPTSMPYRMKFAAAMAGSGLLPAMASASSLTAATLHQQHQRQQQQQQQQQQQPQGTIELLSCALLSLWRACARLWPHPNLLSHPGMVPTVQPAVALAVAVLDCWPGPHSSSNSSKKAGKKANKANKRSAVHVDRAEALQTAAFQATCLADKVAFTLFDELIAPAATANTPLLQQLVTSAEVQRLLLINTACVAQRMHKQLKGRSAVPPVEAPVAAPNTASSSSRKQQQMIVPPYHDGMLSVLGLDGLDTAELKEQATGTETKRKNAASDGNEHNSLVVSVIAVLHITTLRMEANSSRVQTLPGISGTPLPLPLLLLLIEGQLLAPEVEHCTAGLQVLLLVVRAYHLDMPTEAAGAAATPAKEAMVAVPAGPAANPTAADVPSAPADAVLPPVFQLLTPVVLYVLKESGQDKAEEIMVARKGDKANIMYHFAHLIRCIILPTNGRMLAHLFQQQPLLVSIVLDSVLRTLAIELKPRSAAAATHGPEAAAAYQPSHLLDILILKISTPWTDFKPDQMAALLSEAAAAGTDMPTTLLHVCSALNGCIKVAGAAAGSSSGSWGRAECARIIDMAIAAAYILREAAAAVLPGQQAAVAAGPNSRKSSSKAAGSKAKASSSSSTSSTTSTSSTSDDSSQLAAARSVCWLLVVSRGLHHMSSLVLQHLEAAQRAGTTAEMIAAMKDNMLNIRKRMFGHPDRPMVMLSGSMECLAMMFGMHVMQLGGAIPALQSDGAALAVQADLQQLQQQQVRLEQVWSDFEQQLVLHVPAEATTGQVAGLVEQLLQFMIGVQQLAAALCVQLPVRHCCNNLTCLNLARLSELQLVGGRGCICGGCKTARFCGKSCQEAAWKAHKPVCKRLQQGSKG